MKPHDASYKAIFTHPEIIQQLLQDFVKQDWVKELDFSTLEKPMTIMSAKICASVLTIWFGKCVGEVRNFMFIC